MSPRLRIAGLLIAACLALGPLPAQAGWVPVGPPGGDARSLVFDPEHPQTVYAGTADGILYRSDDAGDHWRRLAPGFPLRGQSLDDLTIDACGRLFVAYWEVSGTGGGVARSDDGGQTFKILQGIAGESVRAIAVDARNPDVIVVGTLSGVFRSGDGGETWRRISPAGHLDIRNVESIALDPRDSQVVYAGTWHLAWKTADGGQSWRKAQLGMIDDSDVFTLNLDQRSADVVYGTACSGIYRSPDGAGHWSKIRGIPSSSRRTRAFVQHPARPATFLAGTTEGVWRSDDDFRTWRLVTAKELVVNAVVVLPSGRLLVGADGAGILRSDDAGETWVASNEGFSERFVARVVFDPEHDRVLAAIREDRQHGGVLAARWPGGLWEPLAPGLEGREVFAVAVQGGGFFAGTDDGIFRLAAGDKHWQRVTLAGLGPGSLPRVNDLATIAPDVVVAASSAGLLRTDDGGTTWHLTQLGLSGVVDAVATDASGHVYAATPLGVFASADRGARFEAVAAAPAPVHRLVVADDSTLLAATSQGAYRWTTSGGGRRLWRPLDRLPRLRHRGLRRRQRGAHPPRQRLQERRRLPQRRRGGDLAAARHRRAALQPSVDDRRRSAGARSRPGRLGQRRPASVRVAGGIAGGRRALVPRRGLPLVVARLVAILVAAACWIISVRSGAHLLHFDAKAHLVVARRTIDSLTPGWTQLGAVWLPLPHMLNALPAQVDSLYATGLGGSLLSFAFFLLGIVALGSAGRDATDDVGAGVVALAIPAFNPGWLYLQSTPLIEALFLGLVSAMLAALVRWRMTQSRRAFLAAVASAALACWVRYEAWPLATLAMAWAVFVERPEARRRTALLGLGAGVLGPILLYGLHSWVSTGVPFYAIGEGNLTERRGDVLRAAQLVATGLLEAFGAPLVVAAALAALALAAQGRRARASPLVPLAVAALAPLSVTFTAYVAGHPTKARYALLTAPALALILAAATAGRRRLQVAVLAMAALQIAAVPRPLPVLREAMRDSRDVAERAPVLAAFRAQYVGGHVLASMGSLAPVLYELGQLGLPLREVVHEGNGNWWSYAVVDPGREVRWIISARGDILDEERQFRSGYPEGFVPAFGFGRVTIYRRAEPGMSPVTGPPPVDR